MNAVSLPMQPGSGSQKPRGEQRSRSASAKAGKPRTEERRAAPGPGAPSPAGGAAALRGTLITALTVLLVVATGGIATYFAWRLASDGQTRDLQAAVATAARAKANDVQGALALAQEALYGVASHLEASPDDSGFEAFAATALKRHESIGAIGWVENIPGGNRRPVSQGRPIMQRDWLGNFVPIEPRQRYLVLSRLSTRAPEGPETPVLRGFLGFDFSSDDRWASVMERARRDSSIQISFTGMAGTDSLLFMPVRRRGAASADGQLSGFVVASVALADLMARGLGKDAAALINRVFDDSDKSGLKMLYPASNAAPPSVPGVEDGERELQRGLTLATPLDVLGGRWLVETQPSIGFLRDRQSQLPLLVVAMGGLMTLLLASYVAALRSRNVKVEKLVTERTDQLQKAHNELRDTEMIAMQSEKMSSLGQMVAGVAHEINTPLGFVSSNLQMLKEFVDEVLQALGRQMRLLEGLAHWRSLNTEQKRMWVRVALNNRMALAEMENRKLLEDGNALVQESLVGLERISEIVTTLKDFSRVDRAHTDSVDIHQCIDSTLVIAHNVIKHKAEVIKEYGDLPPVTCSPSQINQVILNLVTNAAQAIEGYGHIWIRTRRSSSSVLIEIRDDGPGIPQEVQARMFEPFFTTKDVGQGTGLGLAICEKIIRAHGGSISFVSQVGSGTTFSVSLPIRAKEAASSGAASGGSAAADAGRSSEEDFALIGQR